MDGHESKEKSKLTLSLNKEVIQRAKAAGINISEITEKLLTAVTLTPHGGSYDDVAEAYGEFLKSIKGILGKYNAEVTVKVGIEEYGDTRPPIDYRIFLNGKGLWISYYDDEVELGIKRIDDPKNAIDHLGDPVKLLENIINSLIEAAERNKEQITRLEFALKLVKALSEEEKGENKN